MTDKVYALPIAPHHGVEPRLAHGSWVHPHATVIGEVSLGRDASVWPGAVIRGDVNSISIGDATNIQDNSVLHVSHKTPANPAGGPLVITLADFAALGANGGIARVDANTSRPIAVTRVNAGTYLAFSMVCPHAGFKPIDIVAGGFECPNHGAQFSANGDWTGGQRTTDLRQYTVVFNAGAGTLTIS